MLHACFILKIISNCRIHSLIGCVCCRGWFHSTAILGNIIIYIIINIIRQLFIINLNIQILSLLKVC